MNNNNNGNGNDASNDGNDNDNDTEPTMSALHSGGDEHSTRVLLFPLNSPPMIRRKLRYTATTSNCQGKKKKKDVDDENGENSCSRIGRGVEETTNNEKGSNHVQVHGTRFSLTTPPSLISSSSSRNQNTKRVSLSPFLDDSESSSSSSSSPQSSLSSASFSPSGTSMSTTRNNNTYSHTNGESRDITEFRGRLKAIQEKRAKHKQTRKQTQKNRLENRVVSSLMPSLSPLPCQKTIIKGDSSCRGNAHTHPHSRTHTHTHTLTHTHAAATNQSKSEPSVPSLAGDETVETKNRALQKEEGDSSQLQLQLRLQSQMNTHSHSIDSSRYSPQTSASSISTVSKCRSFDETTINNNVGTNTTKRWLEFSPSHLSASALALTLASSTSIDMSSSSSSNSSRTTTRERAKHNNARSLRRLICTSPETNVDISFEQIQDARYNSIAAAAAAVNHDRYCSESATPAMRSTSNGHTTTTRTGEEERQHYGGVTRLSDARPSLDTTTTTRAMSTPSSRINSSRLDRLMCTKSRPLAVHAVGKELNKAPRCAGKIWLPKSDPKQQHSSSLVFRALNDDDCDCDDDDNCEAGSSSSRSINIEHDKKARDGLCNDSTMFYQSTAGSPSPGEQFLQTRSMRSFLPSQSPSHSFSDDMVGSNDHEQQQPSSTSTSSINQDTQKSRQTSPTTTITTTITSSTDNHHGTSSTTTNRRTVLRVPRFSRFRKDPWYLRPTATATTSKTMEKENGNVVFHVEGADGDDRGTRTSNSNNSDYFERMMHAVVFVKG